MEALLQGASGRKLGRGLEGKGLPFPSHISTNAARALTLIDLVFDGFASSFFVFLLVSRSTAKVSPLPLPLPPFFRERKNIAKLTSFTNRV